MRSISLFTAAVAMALPLLVSAAPTLDTRQSGAFGGVSGTTDNPNDSSLLDMYASPPAYASSAAASAAPSTDQGIISANSPGADVEGEDEAINSQQVQCSSTNDCVDFCTQQTASDPDVQQFGLSTYCFQSGNSAGQLAPVGICQCGSAQAVDEIVAGLGDAICIAINAGLNLGVEIAANLIPVVGADGSIIQGLFKYGKNTVKKGAKHCDINVCPGHVYTVVDPNNLPNPGDIFCDSD
jgi:hypothetical protein